ncbi:MAG: nucleoside triphosphate pyrophosphohydrolase [Kiritimatiellae bacterium]|nr:nucleoside triphosphate pyrophosphohydrolase [Kiritimatiellia bacterium]MDD3544110.1 nucleoside triphosphate pyrophosphohydrolase [Kiritimatiellia bacterium]MDD4025145.1 nucleoside triphosphate pyrophosphohydrolase [Kiritimatiellia bacterium]MDD4621941.1 nucleoside triphosphate pyrophosphohydrolase [Kiritimatiellia bacterium]
MKSGTELPEVARLYAVMKRLRGPGGCPWDREQTLQTLKPCLLEETYELLETMEGADPAPHLEELGDVLLQVVFQCAIREEEGLFGLNAVAAALTEKLIRRHPHVFGDTAADSSRAVLRNWEAIKSGERGKDPGKSALDGVPVTLPALLKAQRTQEKASRVGFDWEDASGATAKLAEELDEVREAAAGGDAQRVREEIGDLLFSVVNYCRFLGVDAESALESASKKFARRFRAVETRAAQLGKRLTEMDLAAMDALWDEVKAAEPHTKV